MTPYIFLILFDFSFKFLNLNSIKHRFVKFFLELVNIHPVSYKSTKLEQFPLFIYTKKIYSFNTCSTTCIWDYYLSNNTKIMSFDWKTNENLGLPFIIDLMEDQTNVADGKSVALVHCGHLLIWFENWKVILQPSYD